MECLHERFEIVFDHHELVKKGRGSLLFVQPLNFPGKTYSSSHQTCSVKKVFLKISSLFFNIVAGLSPGSSPQMFY